MMVAKLVLSMDGAVLQECLLDKERVTIGRKAHNDIVINNLAVSGVHAAVITILHDSFLEDLESTNGLTVNGEAVKKHFLQNDDVIEIGKYTLTYLNDQVSQAPNNDFEKTMMMRPPAHVTSAVDKSGDTGHFKRMQAEQGFAGTAKMVAGAPTPAPKPTPAPLAAPVPKPAAPAAPAAKLAAVQILNGPNAGKELDLVKSLTTLGKPGVQVAVLTRRPHGFFITHVEGAVFPVVNGQALGEQPHQLHDHDVIELAGVKMEFYFKG
jgi:hypothetical protein